MAIIIIIIIIIIKYNNVCMYVCIYFMLSLHIHINTCNPNTYFYCVILCNA